MQNHLPLNFMVCNGKDTICHNLFEISFLFVPPNFDTKLEHRRFDLLLLEVRRFQGDWKLFLHRYQSLTCDLFVRINLIAQYGKANLYGSMYVGQNI